MNCKINFEDGTPSNNPIKCRKCLRSGPVIGYANPLRTILEKKGVDNGE